MLISILTNRINQSLSYAESLNLTNTEEQKLTIQLVKDLIKLLNLILTKEEKKLYKKSIFSEIKPPFEKIKATCI